MNIQKQSEVFLQQLESRRRNPITARTLRTYQSYLRTWIVPLIGAENLATFENGAMKKFVGKLVAGGLKPATIVLTTNIVKGVISSAMDDNGNELYPRTWNNDFIDLPIVSPRDQKAPTIGRPALETAISRAQGQFKPLYTLLAGTGLRISEALSLRVGSDDGRGSFVLPEAKTIVVRGQIQDGQFVPPKTAAGFREVDMSESLCSALVGLSDHGYLFGGDKPLQVRTAHAAAEKDGIPGFHSLRRFRVTHLREAAAPEDLVKYWIGHSGRDITDRYSKLAQNIALRKEWADKAGLGFTLSR